MFIICEAARKLCCALNHMSRSSYLTLHLV